MCIAETTLCARRLTSLLNITQAQQLGTKIVDEDGMLDLIRTLPGKKSKYEIAAEKEASKVKVFLIVCVCARTLAKIGSLGTNA